MNDIVDIWMEKGFMDRPKLSIELICQDEEELIGQCCRYMIKVAESVKGVVEIIIVDGGSEDRTVDIIKQTFLNIQPQNCIFSFHQRKFTGFADQRNYIYSLCRGEWILNMAADHLFTTDLYGRINMYMEDPHVLTYSFGKVHLYKDIWHMMDVKNRDPMVALHRNDGKFSWEKSSVGLEYMAYDGEVVMGHPAHFKLSSQRYEADVQIIHFEALKSNQALLKKYMKRTRIKGNRWYGLSEEEVLKRIKSLPAICDTRKYFPWSLSFYHEIEKKKEPLKKPQGESKEMIKRIQEDYGISE